MGSSKGRELTSEQKAEIRRRIEARELTQAKVADDIGWDAPRFNKFLCESRDKKDRLRNAYIPWDSLRELIGLLDLPEEYNDQMDVLLDTVLLERFRRELAQMAKRGDDGVTQVTATISLTQVPRDHRSVTQRHFPLNKRARKPA